jgi:hypothetical protein
MNDRKYCSGGCVCDGEHRSDRRKRITIGITDLQEGLNHREVEALLDSLTPSELKTLAMKIHGALYRRLETPQYKHQAVSVDMLF